MHSKNVIYKNGHFYENGHRIELKDNSKVCIVANESDFILEPEDLLYKPEIRTKKQIEEDIKNDSTITEHKHVFDRGKKLYFYIAKNNTRHVFEVELLEELYLFKKGKGKRQLLTLCDCACVVRENLSDTISYFEQVYAKSLSELYKKTFVHYFGNQGSPAGNAIHRFYETEAMNGTNIDSYRH